MCVWLNKKELKKVVGVSCALSIFNVNVQFIHKFILSQKRTGKVAKRTAMGKSRIKVNNYLSLVKYPAT